MTILPATEVHLPALLQHDRHISETELWNLVARGRILVAEDKGTFCGWLRWNLFWDNTPFMNMLYVLEPYRGTGLGTKLTAYWEYSMEALGYPTVMTSTASDEYAQHFYQKLGYETVGGFTPFGDPYVLILAKKLAGDTL